mgnify:CR=1 FL=1
MYVAQHEGSLSKRYIAENLEQAMQKATAAIAADLLTRE